MTDCLVSEKNKKHDLEGEELLVFTNREIEKVNWRHFITISVCHFVTKSLCTAYVVFLILYFYFFFVPIRRVISIPALYYCILGKSSFEIICLGLFPKAEFKRCGIHFVSVLFHTVLFSLLPNPNQVCGYYKIICCDMI